MIASSYADLSADWVKKKLQIKHTNLLFSEK